MTAQQKRERPEYPGKPQTEKPEIEKPVAPKPEMSGNEETGRKDIGRGKPGSMPENPANIDREHEPAGIEPGTDRTQER